MEEIIRIGMDTSKRFFQLHGVNAAEKPLLRKKLTRQQMVSFFAGLPPTLIAIEACGASHYWARELGAMGHEVRLIAPQLVKPYVQRSKHDAADAAALCEAVSRPHMRTVPVKTAEQQADLMLTNERKRLVQDRVRVAQTIRGEAMEYGFVAAQGPAGLKELIETIAIATDLPEMARAMFGGLFGDHARLLSREAEVDALVRAWQKQNATARRLDAIPGVGALISALLVMKTPDPSAFPTGRDYAAWLGLTPLNKSTGGRERLGCITRAGDPMLRSLLVVGATSVIAQVRRGGGQSLSPRLKQWLEDLLARKAPKLVAVALANKIARVAWKMMASGEAYRKEHTAGQTAAEMVAAEFGPQGRSLATAL